MISHSPATYSNFYLLSSLTSRTIRTRHQCTSLPSRHALQSYSETKVCEAEEMTVKEEPRLRWSDVGSDMSESQKRAIRSLSPKLSNRCKALMTRLICLSPKGEDLHALLAFWIKAMRPKRADWLSVLKELKTVDSPLLTHVMEYALLEDSFEADIRDYTKLIHIYGQQKLLQNAESKLAAMKTRGFLCDVVMLTALIDLYSKAGDLSRAKEMFEEIRLLGLPLDKRAYGSMVMAYIRADMLDNAEGLLKEMEDTDISAGREIYKALLRAYSSRGDPDGAQRVFDAIQFAGMVPDTKLCALLVNAYCLSGCTDNALSVIGNMRSAGLKPCDRCVALILSAYEKANSLDRALAFLIELEEDGIMIGKEPSQILAGWLRRLGVVHEVEHVLRGLSGDRNSSSKNLAMPLQRR